MSTLRVRIVEDGLLPTAASELESASLQHAIQSTHIVYSWLVHHGIRVSAETNEWFKCLHHILEYWVGQSSQVIAFASGTWESFGLPRLIPCVCTGASDRAYRIDSDTRTSTDQGIAYGSIAFVVDSRRLHALFASAELNMMCFDWRFAAVDDSFVDRAVQAPDGILSVDDVLKHCHWYLVQYHAADGATILARKELASTWNTLAADMSR